MRQYKIFVVAIQVILMIQGAYCGFERMAQPSAVFGRGMSGIAQQQFENLWINPASVTSTVSFRTSVFYSPSPFQLPQLSNFGLICVTQSGGLFAAIGLHSFGFSLYRETAGSLTLGIAVAEGITAGMNSHLYHLSIAKYGSSVTGVIDLGTLISISERVNLGITVHNVTGSDFGEDDDIPRSLMSGVSLRIEERAVVNVDLVNDLRYPVTYRTGIELVLHEHVLVRAGVQGDQKRIFGGISLTMLPFRIDYGIATHQELGLTHSIGISVE